MNWWNKGEIWREINENLSLLSIIIQKSLQKMHKQCKQTYKTNQLYKKYKKWTNTAYNDKQEHKKCEKEFFLSKPPKDNTSK